LPLSFCYERDINSVIHRTCGKRGGHDSALGGGCEYPVFICGIVIGFTQADSGESVAAVTRLSSIVG